MPQQGILTPGNIDLYRRPPVRNPDGTSSTVRSISINVDGREILIPTVVNGRVVSDDEAIAHYERTGGHLGVFDTPANATAYAARLHDDYAAGRYAVRPESSHADPVKQAQRDDLWAAAQAILPTIRPLPSHAPTTAGPRIRARRPDEVKTDALPQTGPPTLYKLTPTLRAPTRRERVTQTLSDLAANSLLRFPAQMLRDLGEPDPKLYAEGGRIAQMPDAPGKPPIKAYHGSPHDFDRFSLDKIGTGEGAQSYGHGLYFAEREGIAKSYRQNLSEGRDFIVRRTSPLPDNEARKKVFDKYRAEIDRADAAAMDQSLSSNDRTRARLRRDHLEMLRDKEAADTGVPTQEESRVPDWIGRAIKRNDPAELQQLRADFTQRALDSLERAEHDYLAWQQWSNQRQILEALDAVQQGAAKVVEPGRTYEVAIKADPDTLLDWDKPLLDQPKPVFDTLGAVGAPVDKMRRWQRLTYRLKEISTENGNLAYQGKELPIELADEWDRLVSERAALSSEIARETPIPRLRAWHEATGGEFYQSLAEQIAAGRASNAGAIPQWARASAERASGAEIAARRLREAGIPGVKYRDAASRGGNKDRWIVTTPSGFSRDFGTEAEAKEFAAHSGATTIIPPDVSYNYVVFDDNIIEILRKYGLIAGAGGVLGAEALKQQQRQDLRAAAQSLRETR